MKTDCKPQKHGNCHVTVLDHFPMRSGHQLWAVMASRGPSTAKPTSIAVTAYDGHEIGAVYDSHGFYIVTTAFEIAGHTYEGEWPHAWICREPSYSGELWTIGKSDWHEGTRFAIVSAVSCSEALKDSRTRKFVASLAGDYSASGNCVYAISDGAGACKIGKANSVKKRLSQLQTANARSLRVVAVLECDGVDAEDVELVAHRLAAEKSIKGEWFCIGDREAEQLLYEAASHSGVEPAVLFYGEPE